MSRLMLRRIPGGWIDVPEDDSVPITRFKIGELYPADIVEMRNGPFFKKWWALVKTVYMIWKERMPEKEVNGVKVGTSIERFRKDITVLAGYYEPVYNAEGEVRLEPISISWAKMDEGTFAKFYSDTIDAALQKVIPQCGVDSKQLDQWAMQVLRFG